MRVDFDPGYVAPGHTHFGDEIIYVLEGMLEYRTGDKAPFTVRPGDVLFVPAGVIHSVKNIGTGNGADSPLTSSKKGNRSFRSQTDRRAREVREVPQRYKK